MKLAADLAGHLRAAGSGRCERRHYRNRRDHRKWRTWLSYLGLRCDIGTVTKTGDKTATISLQLVDTKGTPATSDDTKYDPYVITLNQVDARTTTNLSEDVVLGRGVYSAEVDNVNKVINVVLARNTRRLGMLPPWTMRQQPGQLERSD